VLATFPSASSPCPPRQSSRPKESAPERTRSSAGRASRQWVDCADLGPPCRAGLKACTTSEPARASSSLLWSSSMARGVPRSNRLVLRSGLAQARRGDVFQLQDSLTRRIVDALAVQLTARDRQLLRHDVPASGHAYELYLRANQLGYDARHLVAARDNRADVVQAFRPAHTADPKVRATSSQRPSHGWSRDELGQRSGLAERL
jgi:hypothetical protein